MVARSLKGSWLPLALVGGALVALAAWASLAGLAHAGANSVTAETVTVPPGGSGTIQITAEAPANDLGAWEIDVEYHSGAITVTGCEAGSVGMNLCDDTFVEPNVFPPGPGKVRVAGDDANGASGELVLATISFVSVVGGVFPTQDGCAEISVTVNRFADPAGNETNPSVTNGKVCFQEATPEPTAAPTATPAGIPDTGGPPASGSDIAAYLLGAFGLALAASGALVVSRMRRREI